MEIEAIRWFEYASDWFMWLIPLAGLAVAVTWLRARKKRRAYRH